MVLLLVGALLSLLKGFDWEEASLMTMTAVLLAIFRRSFYRASRLTELPFSPLYLVSSVCVLGASIWLLLFAYQDVPLQPSTVVAVPPLDANAPRGLRSLLGSRRAAGDRIADLAAAHRPPGDPPADPDEAGARPRRS